MSSLQHHVAEHPQFNFRHLDPIPSNESLTEFYESQYYDLLRKGIGAPSELRRFEGGNAADRERQWLEEAMYTDIVETLDQLATGKRLLEVGCGTGEFLAFARERGYEVVGIEPAIEAAQKAASQGLTVHADTLNRFVQQQVRGANAHLYSVIVLLNVLEHVPDPIGTVRQCRNLLIPGGILCIRVPNDFTELQEAAKNQLHKDAWWIAAPDHINYFNFASLRKLLEGFNFEVPYTQGDFPMEIFLLMGDDYLGNAELGSRCHERRVRFDLGLPPALRRRIYHALGESGLGRNCLMFGRLRMA
jgi:2-polyprenyl-3-methyl-5-hydroxy-6-metoxy-1,4-benzoquinol methylase